MVSDKDDIEDEWDNIEDEEGEHEPSYPWEGLD